MKTLKILTSFISLIISFISCDSENNMLVETTQLEKQKLENQTEARKQLNKKIVVNAIEKVFDGKNKLLIDTYYADGYIQHNPTIADGKEGLILALDNFINNNITIERDLARIIAHGDKVFTHSRVKFIKNGNLINTLIVGDIFRIENNKIKEHWDVIQTEPNPAISNANGNSMLDGKGRTNFKASKKSLNKNIKTASLIMKKVLGNGQLNLVPNLFKEPYIQHNPNIPNGTDALVNFLSNNGPLNLKIKQIIAEGDLVVTFNHIISFNNANIDMFRLNKNGKAVEHWDIIQKIPETSVNGNDFF